MNLLELLVLLNHKKGVLLNFPYNLNSEYSSWILDSTTRQEISEGWHPRKAVK